MINRTISHYKILAKLGEGGMGTVYRGVDTMLDRPVAIKAVHSQLARHSDLMERFRSEAALLARLNDPHIAAVYSFFREGDELFLVMEFVDGETLASLMHSGSPPGPEQSVEIVSKILSGLDHAHRIGILHRDIKPANILVTPNGAVKLTDFGIARALGSERLTRDLRIVGTLEYLAPERIKGEEGDIRSDLYSVGVMLYELLTKRLPFERNSDFELMRAHLEEAPTPFVSESANIAPDLQAIVLRALAKKPEDRFSTAGEMREALLAANIRPALPATRFVEPAVGIAATRFVEPISVPNAPLAVSPGNNRLRWFGVAGAAVLGLILVVLLVRFAHRQAAPPAPVVAGASTVSSQAPAEPVTETPPSATAPTPPTTTTPGVSEIPAGEAPALPSTDDDEAAARQKAAAERAKRRAAALRALDQ